METTKLATKLSFKDVTTAAQTMQIAKSLDIEVVTGIFRIQFPQYVASIESDLYDKFNKAKHEGNWLLAHLTPYWMPKKAKNVLDFFGR